MAVVERWSLAEVRLFERLFSVSMDLCSQRNAGFVKVRLDANALFISLVFCSNKNCIVALNMTRLIRTLCRPPHQWPYYWGLTVFSLAFDNTPIV